MIIVLLLKYFHYVCLFPLTKFYFMMNRAFFFYFLHRSLSTSTIFDTKKNTPYLVNFQQRQHLCTRLVVANLNECDSKPFVSILLINLNILC